MCHVKNSRSKITEDEKEEDVCRIKSSGSVDGGLVIDPSAETRLFSFSISETCKDGGLFIWKSALNVVELDIYTMTPHDVEFSIVLRMLTCMYHTASMEIFHCCQDIRHHPPDGVHIERHALLALDIFQ